jgi:hypothetical protein
MLTKTSLLALAFFIALCSAAGAADRKQPVAPNDGALINRCVPDYLDPTCNRHLWSEKK